MQSVYKDMVVDIYSIVQTLPLEGTVLENIDYRLSTTKESRVGAMMHPVLRTLTLRIGDQFRGRGDTTRTVTGLGYCLCPLCSLLHEYGHFFDLVVYKNRDLEPLFNTRYSFHEAEALASTFAFYLLFPEDSWQRRAKRLAYQLYVCNAPMGEKGKNLSHKALSEEVAKWEEGYPAVFAILRGLIQEVCLEFPELYRTYPYYFLTSNN